MAIIRIYLMIEFDQSSCWINSASKLLILRFAIRIRVGPVDPVLSACFLFAKVFETNETLLFVDLVAEERRSGFPERSFQKSFSEVLLSERSLQKFFLPKTSRITRMPH